MSETQDIDLPGHSCTICFEKFCTSNASNVPRILRCGHTFCTKCCNMLLKSEAITCPNCSQATRCGETVDKLVKNFGVLEIVESFGAGGTSPLHVTTLATTSGGGIGLPRTRQRRGSGPSDLPDSGSSSDRLRCHSCAASDCSLAACSDCHALLCASCSDAVHRIPGFREHQTVAAAGLSAAEINQVLRPSDSGQPGGGAGAYGGTALSTVSSVDPRLYCAEHDGERKKIFCRSCNTLICIYCQMHGSHQQHSCTMARDHALAERVRLDRLCTAVQQRQHEWLQAFNVVMDTTDAVRHSSTRLEDELQRHFRSLRQCLDQRESALRQVLRVFIDERLEALGDQACELSALSQRAKALHDVGTATLQGDASTLLLESPPLSADIQNALLLKAPLHAQARDDIVFRWPRLAMAPAGMQHNLDDCIGPTDPLAPLALATAAAPVSSLYELDPSGGSGEPGAEAIIESRNLTQLITHHGELMILPPAVSPCHCMPYLHTVRIFWSAVDMPDLPLLEYRVEHIYWATPTATTVVATTDVDDVIGPAVDQVDGGAVPTSGVRATDGDGTRPLFYSPPSAAASSGRLTNGVAAVATPQTRAEGVPATRSVSLPRNVMAAAVLLESVRHSGGSSGNNNNGTSSDRVGVAYVKDHFSGEEDMVEAEDDEFDDVDDLDDADSNVLFDMHRDKPHMLSSPSSQTSGITVEPLTVASPTSASPPAQAACAVGKARKSAPAAVLAGWSDQATKRRRSPPEPAVFSNTQDVLAAADGAGAGAVWRRNGQATPDELVVGLRTRDARVASDPVSRGPHSAGEAPLPRRPSSLSSVGGSSPSPASHTVVRRMQGPLPGSPQLLGGSPQLLGGSPLLLGGRPQLGLTCSLPPPSLGLVPALAMPRSVSAPNGKGVPMHLVDPERVPSPSLAQTAHFVRSTETGELDIDGVDGEPSMMSVVVCDRSTAQAQTLVIKTPVLATAAAPRELTLSAVEQFNASLPNASHLCTTTAAAAAATTSASAVPSSAVMMMQSPATFRKTAANAEESTLSCSADAQTLLSSGAAAAPSRGEARRVVYRGKSRTFDLPHSFPANSEHGFRVSVCSRAGLGPWSPITRIAIPGPAFTWNARVCHSQVMVSQDGLKTSIGSNRFWVTVGADTVLDKGCHYWECVLRQYGEPSRNWKVVVGVVAARISPNAWKRDKATIGIARHGMSAPSWGYVTAQGKKVSSLSTTSWGTDYASHGSPDGRCTEGDVVGVLLDLDSGRLEFFQNGHSLGVAFDNVTTPVIPAVSFYHDKAVELRFAPPPPSSSSPLS